MARDVSYRVLNFDLAVPRGRGEVPIVAIGTPFDSISVLVIPAAACSIHVGSNGDEIPLAAGMTVSFVGDEGGPDPTDLGLYLTNPAGAGILTLFVSLSGMRGNL